MAVLKHGFPQLLKNLSPKLDSAPTSRGLQRSTIAGRGIGNFLLPNNYDRYKVEFGCHGEERKSVLTVAA